jgi:hypothetical protein
MCGSTSGVPGQPGTFPYALSHLLRAGPALAGGEDAGEILDRLAEALREARRKHYEALRAVTLPVTGSA